MKKVFSIIFILALVLTLVPLAAYGDTTKEGIDAKGFAYKIEGDTVTITGYNKEVPDHFVIPSTEEGKPVTAIADGFAYNSKKLVNRTLELPSTITYIGSNAFDGCGLIGTLTLPSGLKTIGNAAFCINGFTGDLVIPETVTSLGASAFDGCTGFNGRLTLPSGLTKIEEAVFWRCGFTGSLTIPPNVESIGYSAFEECSGFTGELIIPSKVTSIGAYAFNGCTGFTGDLTIPSSVRTIYNHAFYSCEGFSGKLTILPGVTFIGSHAFSHDTGFKGALVIPSSVKIINRNAFAYCDGFTGTVVVPASVESMDFSALPGSVKVKMASTKTFLHDSKTALAIPSITKVLLNGKAITLDSYLIDTINYIKLDDIATMLNNTDRNFNFTWNAKKTELELEYNTPLKTVSGKMTKKDGKPKKATLASIRFNTCVGSSSNPAYKIGDNYYFTLKDLMSELVISTDYDEETQTVILDITNSSVDSEKE